MSPPYRELYIELPPAESDTLAPSAPATERPWSPRWLDDPALAGALAAEYGWSSVALTPSAADRVVYGVARLACGHELRLQASAADLAAAGPAGADLVDAVDRAVSRAAGRCYCVELAQGHRRGVR